MIADVVTFGALQALDAAMMQHSTSGDTGGGAGGAVMPASTTLQTIDGPQQQQQQQQKKKKNDGGGGGDGGGDGGEWDEFELTAAVFHISDEHGNDHAVSVVKVCLTTWLAGWMDGCSDG